MANPISEQVKSEAAGIAAGIKKPGQSKEQTKLISQGIEKGIALYKKQQKGKSREQDKQRKQILKEKQRSQTEIIDDEPEVKNNTQLGKIIPWFLLITSWVGFIAFQLTIA